jgi:hypothetical protein
VIKRGKIAQVVLGTQSDRIAARINRLLKASTAQEADVEQSDVEQSTESVSEKANE